LLSAGLVKQSTRDLGRGRYIDLAVNQDRRGISVSGFAVVPVRGLPVAANRCEKCYRFGPATADVDGETIEAGRELTGAAFRKLRNPIMMRI
jgi:hypothetical protein